MNKHFQLLKEVIEFLVRLIPSIFVKSPLTKKQRSFFRANGYLILEEKLNLTICDSIIDSFDGSIKDEFLWKDDKESDTRLYYAHKYIDEVNLILNNTFFNDLAKKFYGKKISNKFSLMNKVVPVKYNLGSGGGWHRDSPTTHQLKVLVYLSDVNVGNGQFQLISGSHKKINIIKSIYKLNWVGKHRFKEEEVLKYCNHFSSKPVNIVGQKGTMVILDTKLIHRGAPISNGKRYAIFNYYYKGNIPNHLSKYDNIPNS